MSKYPLGPWTRLIPGDTVVLTNMDSYVLVPHQPGFSRTTPGASFTNSVYREGWNAGHRSNTVLPSVRDDKFISDEPAVLESKVTSRSTGVVGHRASYSCGSTFIPEVDLALLSKLTTKSLSKIGPRARQRVAMLGVTLGEGQKTARETQRLLANLVEHHNTAASNAHLQMTKLWRGLPKTRRSAQRFAKELADNYLNYHLGIKPLVSDIDNLLQATADYQYSKVQKGATFSATSKEVVSTVRALIPDLNYNGFIVTLRQDKHIYGIVKVGGVFVSESDVPDFASRFGLSNNDVIPTIEELIPYSWLVDYASNLSEVCEVAAFPRGAVKDMWIVKIYNETRRQRIDSIQYDAVWQDGSKYTTKVVNPGMMTKKRFSYTRAGFDIRGYMPAIQLELPDFRQLSVASALLASKVFKPRLDKSVDRALQPTMLFHYQRYLRDAHSFKL